MLSRSNGGSGMGPSANFGLGVVRTEAVDSSRIGRTAKSVSVVVVVVVVVKRLTGGRIAERGDPSL